ncbi:CaiB/BaiF CoA transferase family protein [Halioxenophilus sp. WMMB6]|uniref:CaiB/BaiF CoA transferase family protein n=1 Tax=Halioxenophilus sp. WMMB6 TaxID=3073815 RepID=UPI00295E83AE|nr:CoA transferase [Halioxenophilus sp. WMMB6]
MSALTNIKVLEIATTVSAEYCGKLLADFGAEVIKCEAPDGGSPTRSLPPFAAGESGLFAYLNTNKHSIGVALDADAGRAILVSLLAKVDVLVCDQAAAWFEALALTPEQMLAANPKLSVCVITPMGFEQSNEYAQLEDLNVLHASGWGYHTPSAADPAKPPLKGPGPHLVSYESGLDAALCITAALFEREASGLGRFIDISKQAVMASRTDYVLGQMIAGDMNVSNDRRAYDLAGPADIYPCADGFIYIWMSAPTHWQALATMLGAPAWMADFPENWLERECTPERVAVCRQHIGEWLLSQKKESVAETAQKLGLIVVPVNNTGDLLHCPQYQFREYFKTVDHPHLGAVSYPTVPYKMSLTPAALNTPAPALGQDNSRYLAQVEAEA